MATKPTINTQATNSQIKAAKLNEALETLATAVSGCLGRGGTSENPNSMTGNLDMDSNRIQNLGEPINAKDAVTLNYINQVAASGTSLGFAVILEAYTATEGQTVFPLLATYQQAFNNLAVFKNGLRLLPSEFEETTDQSVTLLSAASNGDKLLFAINQPVTTTDPLLIPAGDNLLDARDTAVASASTATSAASAAQTAQGLAEDARDAAIAASEGFPGDALSAANNLSDVDSAATARDNLGLGDAATLNAGTGANNLVQLDGDSKLPAVDGSLLVNLPIPEAAEMVATVTATRDMTAASGSVEYTVAGESRTPKFVVVYARVSIKGGIGSYDGTTYVTMYSTDASAAAMQASTVVYLTPASGAIQSATATLAAGKITLSWTKTGSPTGTATLFFTFYF